MAGVCRGSNDPHACGYSGAACCEGTSVPAVKVSGGGNLTARVAPEWSGR